LIQELFNVMLTKIVKVSTIVLLGISTVCVAVNKPSYASGPTFFCAINKGLPKTYVRGQDGARKPIISWAKSLSPKLTAFDRCKQVSQRFQRSYDNGTLNTITNGVVNGYPVVCAVANTYDTCTDINVLFTLPRGSNSRLVVERLLDPSGLAAGRIIDQGVDKSQIYVDFATYINKVKPEP
jgi:Circadian oscillating protein COP23